MGKDWLSVRFPPIADVQNVRFKLPPGSSAARDHSAAKAGLEIV